MPGDRMIGEQPHGLGISAGGEILERADADMAGRDAGQHRAGQHGFAPHVLSRRHRGQGARRGHAKRRHRLADDVFAQHRPKRGAAIAAARERRPSGALELDVEARAVGGDDLAQQDGAPVAELRHEMAELVAGIGGGERRRAVGHQIAGETWTVSGLARAPGIKARDVRPAPR